MLSEASAELAERYAGLAALRRPQKNPVYALEHGLSPERMSALKIAASQKQQSHGLHSADWLVWVALAAEAGYEYAGEEYWPELASRPGEWRSNNDRDTLRQWFQEFRKKYGGPTPVGRWAEHFSIISWPIANAVLPKYLQNLFTRHLYDLRFEVAHRGVSQPDSIGDFLEQRYSGDSSRLSDFLQQSDLTSQIVLALRDEDQAGTDSRIDPALLSRLVADLGRRRDSREYLKEARQVMRAGRIRFAGRLAVGSAVQESATKSGPANETMRLAARRRPDGGLLVGVIVPDIAGALERANFSDALAKTRIRFCGTDERWAPGVGLLTLSGKDRAITLFPDSTAPVVELSGASNTITELIAPYCRITERPCWVLRRHEDGLFREVLGSSVRVGQSYVIVSRVEFPEVDSAEATLEILTPPIQGLFAYAFGPAQQIHRSVKDALARLHIGTRLGVAIEPVGLNPRTAADGSKSWLSTECVAFQLSAEFSAASYRVRLNSGPIQQFQSQTGELLLSLGTLGIGVHEIEVSVAQTNATASHKSPSAFQPATLSFSITAPQPWQDGMRGRAGFRILTTPATAGLEDVLGGRAGLQVLGPIGRSVTWSIETFDASGHLAAVSSTANTALSASRDQIASALSRIAPLDSEPVETAHRVDIVASIDELGRQGIRFPRVVQPLRWTFDPTRNVVRLVDESAHDKPISICIFGLHSPLRHRTATVEAAVKGLLVETPGALFLARHSRHNYALFVSRLSAERFNSLAELSFDQILVESSDRAVSVRSLARGMRQWQRARSAGTHALLRKSITLNRMAYALIEVACGNDFAAILKLPTPASLVDAQQQVGGSPGFAYRMRTYEWPLVAEDVVEPFCQFATKYEIDSDRDSCRAAVLLAFDPAAIRFGTLDGDHAKFGALLAKRSLLRGAFLARASADHDFRNFQAEVA